MKVLHVTCTLSAEGGGPPVAVRGLTTALAAGGILSEILTTVGGRFGRSPMSVPGIPVHAVAASRLSLVWNGHAPELARLVDQRIACYDIVHVHELWHYPGYAACTVARRRGIPYILSLRGLLDEWVLRQKAGRKRLYMKLVQRPILRSSAAIHALTDVEASQARGLGLSTPVAVIPNGVAADFSDAIAGVETSAFLRRYPMLAGKRVVLFLGRLCATKGLDILAQAFVDVADRFDDAVLLMVGPNEGDTRSKVMQLLAAAGLSGRVTFTGPLVGPDKLSAFACADVFVLPSWSEGLSNAVLEALAAGLPVVISEQCHFPEVAEFGAGAVVRNDVTEVGEAISWFLEDGRRRQEAGSNGRRMVEERYSWPRVGAAFTELYRSVMSSA